MDIIATKIKSLFRITAEIKNETIYFLDDYIVNTGLFKIISNQKFEQQLVKEIYCGELSVECIYGALRKCMFNDFKYKINIEITENTESVYSNHYIFIDSNIKCLLEEIRNYGSGNLLKASEKIQTFFNLKMSQIFENEVLKFREEINLAKSKPSRNKLLEKGFRFFRKSDESQLKIAYLYFLLGEYKEAKEIFIKENGNEEYIFYCQILLNEDTYIQFDCSDHDPIIETRKTYFMLQKMISKEFEIIEVYNLITSYSSLLPVAKSIFEIELCKLLKKNQKYLKRIPFSIFASANILFDNNLYFSCIECLDNFESNFEIPILKSEIKSYCKNLFINVIKNLKKINIWS